MDIRAVLCLFVLPIWAQENAGQNSTNPTNSTTSGSSEEPSTDWYDSTWMIIGGIALCVIVALALYSLISKCCKKHHPEDEDSLKEKLVKGSIPKVTHMDPFAA